MSDQDAVLTKPPVRQCGGCTACCHALRVESIQKPEYTACKHEIPCEGCRIYGSGQPDDCAEYECLWLQGCFADGDRPDRLGTIFHADSKQTINHKGIIHAHTIDPDADPSPRAMMLIRAMSQYFHIHTNKKKLVVCPSARSP